MRIIQVIGTLIMVIGFITGFYGMYQFQTLALTAQSSEMVITAIFSTLALPGMVITFIGGQLVAWDRHRVEVDEWHRSSQYLAIKDHLKPIKHWYSRFLTKESTEQLSNKSCAEEKA